MTFRCSYHQEVHEGWPYLVRKYVCDQHGVEVLNYCKQAATWLGLDSVTEPTSIPN